MTSQCPPAGRNSLAAALAAHAIILHYVNMCIQWRADEEGRGQGRGRYGGGPGCGSPEVFIKVGMKMEKKL